MNGTGNERALKMLAYDVKFSSFTTPETKMGMESVVALLTLLTDEEFEDLSKSRIGELKFRNELGVLVSNNGVRSWKLK